MFLFCNTRRCTAPIIDMICDPSCDVKITFIRLCLLIFTFHLSTSKAYRCWKRLGTDQVCWLCYHNLWPFNCARTASSRYVLLRGCNITTEFENIIMTILHQLWRILCITFIKNGNFDLFRFDLEVASWATLRFSVFTTCAPNLNLLCTHDAIWFLHCKSGCHKWKWHKQKV